MTTTTQGTTKTRRLFRNARTFESTWLRFNPALGMISRPERAGQDVGPHVFIRGASLDDCRSVWAQCQDALIREGFEVVKTERY